MGIREEFLKEFVEKLTLNKNTEKKFNEQYLLERMRT